MPPPTSHEKVGHTGQGLWKHKGWQLPAYIQHVANELIKSGHDESRAIEMAVGIVKNWAHGHDGKGHPVHPDTQAAAAKAIAEWDALKAKASGGRRSTVAEEMLPSRACDRAYALDDLHVRSDGSGRVVEAYAAVFNTPAEVMDQDGHYRETLPASSFNRTIAHKAPGGFGVLFNHGRTIDGTPADSLTLPIGVPLEVKADERGVWTATRYLDNPMADWVLDAVKQGAIKAQSFSGRFTKSSRAYPDGRRRGALPTITRHEVDMREYGPAVFAAYEGAAILGTRAEQFIRTLLETPPDHRLAWLEQFEGLTTPPGADPEALPPALLTDPPALTDDSREHSARSLHLRIRAARIVRGIGSDHAQSG